MEASLILFMLNGYLMDLDFVFEMLYSLFQTNGILIEALFINYWKVKS